MIFRRLPKAASFERIHARMLSQWLVHADGKQAVLAFTSRIPGEGVSTTVAGLACAFGAADPGGVLVLDAAHGRRRVEYAALPLRRVSPSLGIELRPLRELHPHNGTTADLRQARRLSDLPTERRHARPSTNLGTRPPKEVSTDLRLLLETHAYASLRPESAHFWHPLVEPLRALHRNDLADVIEEKVKDVKKANKIGWRTLAKRLDDELLGGRCRRAYQIARGRPL